MSNVTFSIKLDTETGMSSISADNILDMQPSHLLTSLAESMSAFIDDIFQNDENYNYVAKVEFAGAFLTAERRDPVEDNSAALEGDNTTPLEGNNGEAA